MLKQKIINSLLKFNYPQIIFSSAIRSYLKSAKIKPQLIIDCPCGYGETAFQLAKIHGAHILAADRSEDCVEKARINFQRSNIEYICADIKSVIQKSKDVDVFCIINSLFLFAEANEILRMLRQKLEESNGKLILIIPNTAGKNFNWFRQHHPTETKLEIPFDEIKSFFTEFGFNTELIQPVGYTHHFNRKDVRLFSVFRPLYLRALNFFQQNFKIGRPNYFLVVLSL